MEQAASGGDEAAIKSIFSPIAPCELKIRDGDEDEEYRMATLRDGSGVWTKADKDGQAGGRGGDDMRNGVIPLVELQFFAILHFQRGTTPRHAAGNDCRQNRRSAALKLGLFNLLRACWLLLLYVMTDDNVDWL